MLNISRIQIPYACYYYFGINLKVLNQVLFHFVIRRLGWDPKQGESHLDSMLRGELLTALASFGHEATLDEANRRFRIFLDDRNTPVLPPDLRLVTSTDLTLSIIKV